MSLPASEPSALRRESLAATGMEPTVRPAVAPATATVAGVETWVRALKAAQVLIGLLIFFGATEVGVHMAPAGRIRDDRRTLREPAQRATAAPTDTSNSALYPRR